MKSNDKYIEEQNELYKIICKLENIDGKFEFDGQKSRGAAVAQVHCTKARQNSIKTNGYWAKNISSEMRAILNLCIPKINISKVKKDT